MDDALIKFHYEVKVAPHSTLLKKPGFIDNFPAVKEMVIYSEEFNSYKACQEKLNGVLFVLSRLEADLSKRNHVIVSKANPSIDGNKKQKHSDAGNWDKFTLVKTYIADSEKLKQSNLSYTIIGHIRADHEVSLACQSMSGQPDKLS